MDSSTVSTSATRVARRIKAPRASVYRALTDRQAVLRWMVPDGMSGAVHLFDVREGGAFRISLTYETARGVGKTSARTDTHHGRFVELVPDERIVQVMSFETGDESMQGEMRVTFELADVPGGTEIRALHEDVPPGVAPRDNEAGWRMSLDKLAALVEQGQAARDGEAR